MIDAAALHDLATQLRAAFDAGVADMDADELREACRPAVPHDQVGAGARLEARGPRTRLYLDKLARSLLPSL